MKARAFLLATLAIAISLLSLGLGGWWVVLQSSTLRLQGQLLHMPEAARFIPRTALMSFHLLTPPNGPAYYARALSSAREKNQAEKTVNEISNQLFMFAGLAYPNELANWIGADTSFAIFTPSTVDKEKGWLLALSTRNAEVTRRFLQRFWELRRLSNPNIRINNYKGIGLISSSGISSSNKSDSLTTAFVNENVLLIGSTFNIITEALDVSQVDELNQAHDSNLLESIHKLEKGVAFFTAQPEVIQSQLGLPIDLTENNLLGLVSTLRPINNHLIIDSLLRFSQSLPTLVNENKNESNLVKDLGGDVEILALINGSNPLNSSTIFKTFPSLMPLINSLPDIIPEIREPLLASILENTSEPILWARTTDGWLLGTDVNNSEPLSLLDIFRDQNLIKAPLLFDDFSTDVWTHLEASIDSSKASNRSPLEASLVVARQKFDNLAWWGQNLTVLRQRIKNPKGSLSIINQLESLDRDNAAYKLVFTEKPAQQLIEKWKNWNWLQKLSTHPLTLRIGGIAISVSSEEDLSKTNNTLRVTGNILLKW